MALSPASFQWLFFDDSDPPALCLDLMTPKHFLQKLNQP